MVVDGRVGFTGGMNIRETCLLELNLRYQVRDLHFRVKVRQWPTSKKCWWMIGRSPLASYSKEIDGFRPCSRPVKR
jgi:hypothetical protein